MAKLTGRHLLLLQGPAGPFFARVSQQFREAGARVSKVNFNGGEDYYYDQPGVVRFRGALSAWPAFFEALVRERGVDAIVLFGDCRPVHRAAIERARQLGLQVYVFEEGYVRPDYVTFERDGVNGHSLMPRDPRGFDNVAPLRYQDHQAVEHAFAKSVIHTIYYATATALARKQYPHYVHHRDIRPFVQMWLWIRGAYRRLQHTIADREVARRIEEQALPPYFFVPLQVHLDSQLKHSRFGSMSEFIREVVADFAKHAPADNVLVLKLHPMDRAYCDYSEEIAALREQYGLGERLLYVDIINLPAALRGARGTIVINSTTGLSSMHHGTPVKCLGTAVYDLPGLTHQGPLADFFRDPGSVDEGLARRFHQWLINENQLNGSVWSCLFEDPSRLVRPLDER